MRAHRAGHRISTYGFGPMASPTVYKFQTNGRRPRMTKDKTAQLLNEIGQLLAEDRAYPLDDTLLYAEVGSGYVAPSIFKDRGDHILYRNPDLDRLGGVLLDLWEAQNSDKRWRELEYVIRDGNFHASFNYPDIAEEEPLDVDR